MSSADAAPKRQIAVAKQKAPKKLVKLEENNINFFFGCAIVQLGDLGEILPENTAVVLGQSTKIA